MGSEAVIKDVGDIYSRLFDHHPVIQGEINIFLNEFEKKRNDRENVRLQRGWEYCREIQEKQIGEAEKLASENLTCIIQQVASVVKQSEEVLSKEAENDQKQKEFLEEKRRCRGGKWEEFIKQVEHEKGLIDRKNEEDLEKVKSEYKDLEQKLKISS